jgi:hypothetical protein
MKKSLFFMYLGLIIFGITSQVAQPFLFKIFSPITGNNYSTIPAYLIPLLMILGTQLIWLNGIKRRYASEIRNSKGHILFWFICSLVFPFSVLMIYLMPMVILFFAFGGFVIYPITNLRNHWPFPYDYNNLFAYE